MGRALLAHLISESETEGYWTLQAQMIAANAASIALHLACGFRQVGYRERYGHLDGIWYDVILLERRSANTGGPGLPTKTCS